MSELELRYFSIVFLGNMNPQILNHDFLLHNEILPKEDKYIKALLDRPHTVDDFDSIPGFALLRYGSYEIRLELTRYQMTDKRGRREFEDSPIIDFTKRYFNLLSHTPISVGGFNLAYQVRFDNDREKEKLLGKIFAPRKTLKSCFEDKIETKRAILFFDFLEGKFEFNLGFDNSDEPLSSNINVNYEFAFSRFQNMSIFLEQLNNVRAVESRFREVFKRMR